MTEQKEHDRKARIAHARDVLRTVPWFAAERFETLLKMQRVKRAKTGR